MSTTYSAESPLTKSLVWSALCEAAHRQSDEHDGPDFCGEAISDAEIDDDAAALIDIFRPLLGPIPDQRPLVVGHLAQSLDGCIAQANGESHWISGDADLDHTHRLRAICDAVLVGAETVAQDDCQLSVRRVAGPNPLRVVLDPRARLDSERKIFRSVGGRTLWVVGADGSVDDAANESVELIRLPSVDGEFSLSALLTLLHERGCRRVFVEGGGVTISRFIRAGLLDRLHMTVAPVLIGGGRPTIGHPLGASLADCPRPAVRLFSMGVDWLFDCDFQSSDR